MVRYYEWIAPGALSDDELFLDLAVYGMKTDKKEHYHKIIEDKLKDIGGLKTLISHNYYSETDFWSIWNKKNYEKAKQITDPDNIFRNLYAKTCRATRGLS
jgi:ABC-type amino acid transport substrate-binding protein